MYPSGPYTPPLHEIDKPAIKYKVKPENYPTWEENKKIRTQTSHLLFAPPMLVIVIIVVK